MKHFFAVLLPFLVIFLGGCTQTIANVNEEVTEPVQPQAELEFSSDMLSQNQNASDAICYEWLEAQIHQFNLDDVRKVFFADDPIVSEESNDYGGYSVYVASSISGAYLQMEYNSPDRQTIFYKTPWYDSKVHLLVKDSPADMGAFNMNNVDELPQGENLKFATIEEAEDSVGAALKQLGYENVGMAEVYSLSPETLTTLDKSAPRIDDNGNDMPVQTWTDEDACYYMVFHQEHEGIVFSREGLQWDGSNITVYYSARGIECLEIQSPFEVTGIGERMDMPSLEDAKAIVTQKYDSMILTNDIVVEEISLEYIMVPGEGQLVPSWRIIISEDYGEYQYKSHLRFNALTGKQMTW